MTILVVDDDVFFGKLIVAQLTKIIGGGVEFVDSADLALHYLSVKNNCDFLICDLQMPGVDGVQFIKSLAEFGFNGKLIIISGENKRVIDAAKLLASAYDLNIVGALEKPVDIKKLSSIIMSQHREFHSSTKYVTPRIYGYNEIKIALSEDQFEVHLQAQTSFDSGKVIGFESLVRWHHPEDGIILPDIFIKTAEELNLIGELTAVVLQKSIQAGARLHALGYKLRVSVNISSDDLLAPKFADYVVDLCDSYNFPTNYLTLEVTESKVMKDIVLCLVTLTRLRLKKIVVSIDDFGTGHSSLAQLRDMPFGELKIDKTFVYGVAKNEALQSFVQSTILLSKGLGLITIAEGVEDKADFDYLKNIGCIFCQGWLVSKPLPFNEFISWVSLREVGDE